MYYRRKIALAILEEAGGHLTRTDIQKLVFLFSSMQDKKAYDFFPYKFGCYSLQLDADLQTLEKQGIIECKEDGWNLKAKSNFATQLTPSDRTILLKYLSLSQNLRGKSLIHYIYTNYPYYAIQSEILNEVLTTSEINKVQSERPIYTTPALFTIGYEGKTAESYINQLITNGIRILCDIRKNAFSMKFGFSKNKLKWLTKAANIEYLHLPDLGIKSQKRKSMHSPIDYHILFEEYKQTVLKNNKKDLNILQDLLQTKNRIALTCFERDPNDCHRSIVASEVIKLFPENPLSHL